MYNRGNFKTVSLGDWCFPDLCEPLELCDAEESVLCIPVFFDPPPAILPDLAREFDRLDMEGSRPLRRPDSLPEVRLPFPRAFFAFSSLINLGSAAACPSIDSSPIAARSH